MTPYISKSFAEYVKKVTGYRMPHVLEDLVGFRVAFPDINHPSIHRYVFSRSLVTTRPTKSIEVTLLNTSFDVGVELHAAVVSREEVLVWVSNSKIIRGGIRFYEDISQAQDLFTTKLDFAIDILTFDFKGMSTEYLSYALRDYFDGRLDVPPTYVVNASLSLYNRVVAELSQPRYTGTMPPGSYTYGIEPDGSMAGSPIYDTVTYPSHPGRLPKMDDIVDPADGIYSRHLDEMYRRYSEVVKRTGKDHLKGG